MRTKIITWWIWWTLKWPELWDKCKCLWIWWCPLWCLWWICKDPWWEEETTEECTCEETWTIEEELEEEVDNKEELLEKECKPDTLKLWLMSCSLKCKDKWLPKDLRLLLDNNNHNNRLNSLLFNNLKIICLNSWN